MPSVAWFVAGFFAGALAALAVGGYAMWRAIRILTLTVALAQNAKPAEPSAYGKGIN